MRKINLIVIHCSASPNGVSLFRYTDSPSGKSQVLTQTPVQVINGWHATRGFKRSAEFSKRFNPNLGSIGYHFVIYTNGSIATGRHLDEVGSHVRGHNADSVGICMVGTDQYTSAQWDALRTLVTGLLKQYQAAKVCGHRDLSADKDGDGVVEPYEWLKTCPGFDVRAWGKSGMQAPKKNQLPEKIID